MKIYVLEEQKKVAKGKGTGKGPYCKEIKGGGKGPPVAKGAGKSKASTGVSIAASWYSSERNFEVKKEKADDGRELLRYTEGDETAELERSGDQTWSVTLPSGQSRTLELSREDDIPVIRLILRDGTSSDPLVCDARKTGNVFITEARSNAVRVKANGLAAGDEVTYRAEGQTPLEGGVVDGATLYVRPIHGSPGWLGLYESRKAADTERIKLSPPYLEASRDDCRVTVFCDGHGFEDGAVVVLTGILDASKTAERPWDKVNEEFVVSDSTAGTFMLKLADGSAYFSAESCVGKRFDGISSKVQSLAGRVAVQPQEAGAYGKLIPTRREFKALCAIGQLTESLEETKKLKDDNEALDIDGVDLSAIDESATLEKKKCPRCEQLIPLGEFGSHWSNHSSEILPYLFLGGDRNAWNEAEITKRTGITHILNVAGSQTAQAELLRYYAEEGRDITFQRYGAMEFKDDADFDLLPVMREAVDFIRSAREGSHTNHILVHCIQGISRSSSVVIAYLMEFEGMSLLEAYQHVSERRSVARPRPNFIEQLGKLEMILRPDLEAPTLKPDDVFHGENVIDLDRFDAPVEQKPQ